MLPDETLPRILQDLGRKRRLLIIEQGAEMNVLGGLLSQAARRELAKDRMLDQQECGQLVPKGNIQWPVDEGVDGP